MIWRHKMINFVAGIVVGIIISSVGFTVIAEKVDQGIGVVQESVKKAKSRVKTVDKSGKW